MTEYQLKLAQLLISAITPVAVVLIGYWINRRLKTLEHQRWANEKLIEKRLQVFEEMAPSLNDLMCYFTYVGVWKDLQPPAVIKIKRGLDKTAHVNAVLFPDEFLLAYDGFMDLLYGTFGGWGTDARLRTRTGRRREAAGAGWDPKWDDCFSDESEVTDPLQVRARYNQLMAVFAKAIGIGLEAEASKDLIIGGYG